MCAIASLGADVPPGRRDRGLSHRRANVPGTCWPNGAASRPAGPRRRAIGDTDRGWPTRSAGTSLARSGRARSHRTRAASRARAPTYTAGRRCSTRPTAGDHAGLGCPMASCAPTKSRRPSRGRAAPARGCATRCHRRRRPGPARNSASTALRLRLAMRPEQVNLESRLGLPATPVRLPAYGAARSGRLTGVADAERWYDPGEAKPRDLAINPHRPGGQSPPAFWTVHAAARDHGEFGGLRSWAGDGLNSDAVLCQNPAACSLS